MKKNEKNATTVAQATTNENTAPKTATAKAEQAAPQAEQPTTQAEQPTTQAEQTAPTATPPATPEKAQVLDKAKKVVELSKRIEELEEQLRKEPQTIEERIAYYEHKQTLTERYKKLQQQVRNLDNLRKRVEEENIDADDFEDRRDFYRLQLLTPGYREEVAISIGNQALIDSVLDLLKSRMLDKATALQEEIAA